MFSIIDVLKWVSTEQRVQNKGIADWSPARQILFPRIDQSHCDNIHSSLTTDHG